jgi:DNA replicative helicase MCM subunit Mcm2 (Cdc46/Mcm family)
MPDQMIKCQECGTEFAFTERDQEFYGSKTPPWNPPKRCKTCRDKRKASRGDSRGGMPGQ